MILKYGDSESCRNLRCVNQSCHLGKYVCFALAYNFRTVPDVSRREDTMVA